MVLRLALAVALVAWLGAAAARAQTNIDEGKSPGQIFANDCATCHKSARGLAAGKSTSSLASFLREHYTSNPQQASALAAFVMGAGGGDTTTTTQGRGQKPTTTQARTPSEEAKPAGRSTQQSVKPEERAPASAKLQRSGEDAKPGRETRIMTEPGSEPTSRRGSGNRRDTTPASRDRRTEPEASPPATTPEAEPAAVTTAPPEPAPSVPMPRETPPASAPAATPQEATTPEVAPSRSAAAPENVQPGDTTPVPRDNIPD